MHTVAWIAIVAYSVDLVPLVTGPLEDRGALGAGRWGLVVTGAATAALALRQIEHPTGGTVAIFAQHGMYLLFSASFVPLACRMFVSGVPARAVSAAVAATVVTYLGIALLRLTPFHNKPAFLGTATIEAGWLVVLIGRATASLRTATPDVI